MSALDPTSATLQQLLTGLSRGQFGPIAPERIAAHVAEVAADADWPVQRAAIHALARRYRFGERDALSIAERPAGGALLGSYRTRSANADTGGTRPYRTELSSLEPLRTSCSCADFVRSSLGLCKHGLVVLASLEAAGALSAPPQPQVAARPRLRWEPVQPLQTDADRLLRVRFSQLPDQAHARLAQRLSDPHERRDPARRLALLDALDALARAPDVEVEPALRTLLDEERARAERLRDGAMLLAAAATADGSLHGLKRTLYPYQREGVLAFLARGRLLLADDMGLGKTTQAIAACHALAASQRVQRALIIVPAPLRSQWRREWEATTSLPLHCVEGSRSVRLRSYRAHTSGFLLLGYEQLLRDFAQVQQFAPELVVLDEAQRIKNWATKSAAYVKALAPAYRLVLTGTPFENRLDELASIMDFVDDIALEPKWRLAPFHTLSGEGDERLGARNLGVLRERLAGSMLRRVRKEVLKQLPVRTDTVLPVELTEVQGRAHDDLKRPLAELVARAGRRPLAPAEFMRLMQLLTSQRMVCNGMAQVRFEESWARCSQLPASPALLESLFAPKLSVLRALLEQVVIEQGRRALVFSQWRNMLRLCEWAVRDLLAAHDMRALFFTGAETSAQRERALRDFHEDPRATVLFLSDAGGTGLNLQRAASCCINLELPWNPAVLEQRVGRIYRLGQEQPIDVYNLVSEQGIEANIARLLTHKSALFSGLFDGTSDEVRFEGQASFLKTVQRVLGPLPALVASESEELELVEPRASELPGPEATEGGAGESVATAPDTGCAPTHDWSRLSIAERADGSLVVEAPPELALALSALLRELRGEVAREPHTTFVASAEGE